MMVVPILGQGATKEVKSRNYKVDKAKLYRMIVKGKNNRGTRPGFAFRLWE
jgi:hypothetical protein